MNRGTRIGRANARVHDKLRSIFLSGECLKVFNVTTGPYTTPTATYTNHWYLDKRVYTELVTGKKFQWLVVDDVDGSRLQKLREMTAVVIGEVVYKFNSKDSFVGSVPTYQFKVYPTGERI